MYIVQQGYSDPCYACDKSCQPPSCFSELGELQSAARQLLTAWKQSLEHDCTKGTINPRLNQGADVAKNRAVATQAKWGAHKTEGGLYWATYKVHSIPSSVPFGLLQGVIYIRFGKQLALQPSCSTLVLSRDTSLLRDLLGWPQVAVCAADNGKCSDPAASSPTGNSGDCWTTWSLTLTCYAGYCAACQEWSVQVQLCW